MFRGLHHINLDAKGRLAIPTKYRERLAESCAARLVVTVNDQDRCLLVYPLSEWEKVQEKINALPDRHPAARKLKRMLIGYATDLDCDANGRIQLSQPLREYAHLAKETVLVGLSNKFELWDKASWEAQCEDYISTDMAMDEMPAELLELSL